MSDKRTDDTHPSADQPRAWSERTLKLAGGSYILGDIMMFVAGVTREIPRIIAKIDPKKDTLMSVAKGAAGSAVAWLIGGVGAAYYGNPNIEKQLEIQASKLEHYLKQKGITIPTDAREQSKLLRKKSLWENLNQFLYEHPSEILNSMYAIGSLMLIHRGVTHDLTKAGGRSLFPKKYNLDAIDQVSTNFWIGSIVLLGTLVGLFVKEDPEAKEKAENSGGIGKLVAFVKEKPLRTSAGFYTLNNVFLGLQAWQDANRSSIAFKDQAWKPHYFSTTQLAIYLFGNAMLLMSNRDQITKQGFKLEEVAELEKAAACVVAAQPPEMQRALLADLSAYLAKEKGITVDAPTLASHLASRVAEVTNNRLQQTVSTMKWAERTARPDAQPPERGV